MKITSFTSAFVKIPKRNSLENYQVHTHTRIPPQIEDRVQDLTHAIKAGTREGKPETLKGQVEKIMSQTYGVQVRQLCSRRINQTDRLIYGLDYSTRTIHIFQVQGHYSDT